MAEIDLIITTWYAIEERGKGKVWSVLQNKSHKNDNKSHNQNAGRICPRGQIGPAYIR